MPTEKQDTLLVVFGRKMYDIINGFDWVTDQAYCIKYAISLILQALKQCHFHYEVTNAYLA